ncbi:MAG: molybdopterin molybdotransferase MoeA [Saprospiraceae bacterium]|nr:molybdopterin molybdotransferase MoeA [Saprospiraceae bacterium]
MEFIHYQTALEQIFAKVPEPKLISVPLEKSIHFFTAENILAPIDIPVFDNSAMDGFGFCLENLQSGMYYPVIGEIKAGAQNIPPLLPGQALKVFTGAPVSMDIKLVIPKELCILKDDQVKIIAEHWEKGQHIREKGTQSRKDEIIVPENTKITPGLIGMLATFGIQNVLVYARPKMGVIITGDELAKPGTYLKPGQIYESNSLSLKALLKNENIEAEYVIHVQDDPEEMRNEIEKGLLKVDILLITGGISVGDYDFVQKSLEDNGVEKIFYKIKQKPGKPLYFGIKDKTVIFALPGNPASVFTCFLVYVKPFIHAFISGSSFFTFFRKGKITHDFEKKSGLTHWLKAVETDGDVKILTGQESYKMSSFVEANCLARLDENTECIHKGSELYYIKI